VVCSGIHTHISINLHALPHVSWRGVGTTCPEAESVAGHVVRVYAPLLFAGLPQASFHQPGIPASRVNTFHSRCYSGVHRRGHQFRQAFLSCLRLLRRSAKPPLYSPLLWEHTLSFSVPYSLRLCNDCNDTRTRNALTLSQPVLTFTALSTPTRSTHSFGKTFTMPNHSASQRAR
jgi:hypothetical protein